jgi:hypothetical protein
MATKSQALMHSTYFNLGPNNTPDVANAFMAEASENLSSSKGMIGFWISTRATDMNRTGNDVKFDLGMHQIFKDEDSFNLYNGTDPKHEQFVKDVNRWTPVTTRRVMDTYLTNFIVGGNPSAPLKAQSFGTDGNYPQGMFHSLYFSLVNKSPASISKFTGICVKYLSQHPGILQFTTGGITDIIRDVSVRNFNVGVDIIYESKQAYDNYLKSQGHDDFFPATKGMISNTYIFDSYIRYESKVFSLTR